MDSKLTALVIGNGFYPGGNNLKNPVNDANDITAKLTGYGFDVVELVESNKADMEKGLKSFKAKLEDSYVGLFFFAGHGMQIEGVNYLLALDTDTDDEISAKHSALSLDYVIDVMAKSATSTKIIILDACRNNPWERKWHREAALRGLASVYAPKGTIIGFATSPGETAADGAGRNGAYTAALLQHIDTPDCSIEAMFKKVRNTLAAATKGKQTSWEHTSLSGDFYFNVSLGRLIEEYSDKAIADTLFILDESKKSHRIIRGLKTHNWYMQNPALSMLDADAASHMANDSLFVIGRNIYQAACGSADNALNFIRNFITRTTGFDLVRRKAILDGILFEVFFDPQAKLREKIKSGLFNEVFDLQQYTELQASFDFIAEALVKAHANFHTVPGKGHSLDVTIAVKNSGANDAVVEAVYLAGIDVLREEEDTWDTDDKRYYYNITAKELGAQLSEELVVPQRLLTLTYTPELNSNKLRFPMGWTVRKA